MTIPGGDQIVPASSNAQFPAFQNILNLRDVGKTINDFLGEKRVVEGRLFRSARPDDATLSDRKRLKNELGIKTVMDLRTVTEHVNQAKKREGDLKIPALLQSNEALAEPVKIPGMKYLEININGKGFERSLLWQLKATSFAKLVTLMLLGYRMEAIGILGREVMQPRGLVGLGYDSLDHCGAEIADALRAFSCSDNLPMVAHCTQGKDRTGLVITLILLLLEVPLKAITYDYCLSEAELLPERESRLVEIRQIGLTDDFAGCPPDWVEKMHAHLEEKYGGIQAYCTKIGFSEEDRTSLRDLLKG
ncbi:tyrosine protein phosphatase-like protein [Coleophoma cylindrospora]|uniref:Tyrosine protein phosphatase-like protein n=1 Tax=Coleophoma cylindrospora TaxID=1849047 RepID=A0A3D8QSN4_9HELO|nr:tyrosine protein phosphatase-like protein [Coleophoma cylindrospora]